MLLKMGVGGGVIGRLRVLKIFLKHQRKMMKGINESFIDIYPYIEELEANGKFKVRTNESLQMTYPNNDLWQDLEEYTNKNWDIVKFGFTKLPNELIFRDKAVFPILGLAIR